MYLFSYTLSRNYTYFSWTIVSEHVHQFLRKSEGIELKFIVNLKGNDHAVLISVGKHILYLLSQIQCVGKSGEWFVESHIATTPFICKL